MPDDAALMKKALALAARAVGNTSPNPMVGAIVTDAAGSVVATGFHERAGEPHAEAVALDSAAERARGGTLYVTLEPCNHHGKTPPCTDAIVRSGVARVVVAVADVDERVRGAGIQKLRDAGIRVEVGVAESEAHRVNRMYFHQRSTGRPFVALKMAQSLDGAIGRTPNERTPLTGARAAAYVRSLRYEHDAVMVGVNTAIIDDPYLTVRPFRARAVPYTRVVVDSIARLPLRLKIVTDQQRASTLVAVAEGAPAERITALEKARVEVIKCRADAAGRVDLRDLLERLGGRGMLGVLCEGGPTLAGALLESGLVNELHLIAAPVLLGSVAQAPVLSGVTKPVQVRVETVRRLDEDVAIVASILPT